MRSPEEPSLRLSSFLPSQWLAGSGMAVCLSPRVDTVCPHVARPDPLLPAPRGEGLGMRAVVDDHSAPILPIPPRYAGPTGEWSRGTGSYLKLNPALAPLTST